MVEFLNPLGLWALVSLALLTLFYLFMHRPKKMVFPSIMFFMKEEKVKKSNAFFQKLLVNLLFFIQLLILGLISFSIASPVLESAGNTTSEHVILVIDASASMQSQEGAQMRFEEAIDQAKIIAEDKSKVSVILAQNFPITVVERASASKAITIIEDLQPSDTKASLADAMLQAITLGSGNVHVLSDFQSHATSDVLAAQSQLKSAGFGIQFNALAKPSTNIGIVDGEIYNGQARMKIKNFNPESTKFTIQGSTSQEITLQGKGLALVDMPLEVGENTFQINVNDQMQADNKAYFYQPAEGKIKTLLITNQNAKSYTQTALESIPVLDVTVAKLPNLPVEQYDLYIIDKIDPNRVLPTTFEELNRKAKAGAHVVVNLQQNSLDIDYEKLQLIDITAKAESAQAISLYQNAITKGVNFGSLSTYFTGKNNECTPWVVTDSNSTVICHREVEEGSIIMNGLLEENSFKSRPDYPIFYNNIVNNHFGEQEIQSRKTGELIAHPMQKVQTPYGELVTNKLILDMAGFYKINNETFAANVFDYEESDVNTVSDLNEAIAGSSSQANAKEKKQIAKPLMLAALLFIIIELYITKRRGEI